MKKNIFTYILLAVLVLFAGCGQSEYEKHRAEGKRLLDEKKYSEAISYFSLALNINPKEKESLFLRGKAKYAQKQYEEAIDDFSLFLDITKKSTPEQRAAYVARGLTYAALNKYRLSLNDYQSALDLKGRTSDIYYARGKLYLAIEAFKRAKSDLKFAAKIDDDNKYIVTTLGKYYYFQKQYKTSIKYFKQAIAIDPEYDAAIYFLGRAYLYDNNRSLAFDQCNKLGKLNSPLKNKLLKMYLNQKDSIFKVKKI